MQFEVSYYLFFLSLNVPSKFKMNLTIPLKFCDATQSCFEWCKEQISIQENNLQIDEMSFIVIALASLLLNNFIYYHAEFLIAHGLDEHKLEKLHDATSSLSFVMLIMFIIYMVWFR